MAQVPSTRPTFSPRKRNPRQILREEWGILLLAIALTAYVWNIARDKVKKERTLSPRIVVALAQPETSDALVEEERLALKLDSSRQEFEEVIETLGGSDPRVTLRVTRPPGDSSSRGFNSKDDHIDLDFMAEWLVNPQDVSVDKISGWVYAIEKKDVPIALPQTIPDQATLDSLGWEVEISLSKDMVTLNAPADAVRGAIQPDPIELTAWLQGLTEVTNRTTRSVTFNEWVATEVPGGQNRAIRAYRAQRLVARLADIQVGITAHQTGEADIENRLVIVADHDEYEFTLALGDHGVLDLEPYRFKGKLKGRKEVLERLERNKEKWCWGLRITSPQEKMPTTEEPGPLVDDILGRFVWVPLDAEFRDAGIAFVPTTEQNNYSIKSVAKRTE